MLDCSMPASMNRNMTSEAIESLQPEGPAIPLNIRVIRKWLPYWREQELCYLFVDNQVGKTTSFSNTTLTL
jgi:hypothetical protein